MEQRHVIRSAMLVGGLTTLSRFLGMIRDLLTANLFGTSLAMSAFVIAFRIPNLFRRLFGEGALSSAFIPVFMETRRKDGDLEAWSVAHKVFTVASVILAVLTVMGMLAATWMMMGVEAGTQRALILPMTRIMLPYMFFICLAALSMAVLNSFHHFTIPALTPTLMNIVWMIAVVAICPYLGTTPETQIYGVAWAVLVSGVIQLVIQWPVLRRFGYRFRLSFHWNDPRVIKVFTLMGPATIGLAVTQINIIVSSLLAAWIGPWAPSALFYSERLLYFPQGILATAMSTVLLPVFAGHAARAAHDEMAKTLNHSLRTLLFVMMPASVGLFVLAQPIVQMIYEHGRFDANSTLLTARALQFYAPGLLVFCLAKVFVPAFYSLKDTRTPVKIGLLSVAINFGLNVLFILTLPTYWKHAGLALSTVIAEIFNGLVLGYYLNKKMGNPGWGRIFISVFKSGVASAVMAIVSWVVYLSMMKMTTLPEKINQVAAVMTSIGVGMIAFYGIARFLKCEEVGDVWDAIKRRRGIIKKTRDKDVPPTMTEFN